MKRIRHRSNIKKKPFFLKDTTIDDIAMQLGIVYKQVTWIKSPLFRWTQIISDISILSEDIRRANNVKDYRKAYERAGRILMRILSFLGHYLYIHPKIDHRGITNIKSSSDLVAYTLQKPSFVDYFPSNMFREGPSKWVLAKYPNTCSKCGSSPCICIVEPWIFEERRKKPTPYFDFQSQVKKARRGLKQAIRKNPSLKEFTLPRLLNFFESLYRNHYYREDPWRLTMHLYEEFGEATAELTRLELAFIGLKKKTLSQTDYKRIFDKVEEETQVNKKNLIDDIDIRYRKKIDKKLTKPLTAAIERLNKKYIWSDVIEMAGLRFKDETADLLSWLSAVICKLCSICEIQHETALERIVDRYLDRHGDSGVRNFKCSWCNQSECRDWCLIGHEVSEEIMESTLKF